MFPNIEDRFTSTPVLTLSEGNKGFIVFYYASRVGLGLVLKEMGK